MRAIAPLALMGLIFYLSAQSDPGADIGTVGRIAAHFGEYALLAALWTWALAPALDRRAVLAAAAISLLYAISDEWHQSFVPRRDADPLDIVVDAAGIAAAAALIRARAARSPRTARRAPAPPA
ncbi:MAG: VanZ family protein [Solirubrobacterales bacterium]